MDTNVGEALCRGEISFALELVLGMHGEARAEHAILAVELLALRGRASHAAEVMQQHGLASRVPRGLFESVSKLGEAFGAPPLPTPIQRVPDGYRTPPKVRDCERLIVRSTREGAAAIAKAAEAEGLAGTYDADMALARCFRRDRDWAQVTRLLNAHRETKWHSPVFWLFSADSAAAAGKHGLATAFIHEALAIEPGWSQPRELLLWMADNPPRRRSR